MPGTQATVLMDGHGRTIFNAVRVGMFIGRRDLGDRTVEEVGRVLGMEHDPGQLAPTRSSLEAGTDVRTGAVLRTPYDGLPVTDWFRYDWRADLRFNGKLLLRFLRDRARQGGRWNLIGHSQGGLLIVLASKFAEDPREFAELVGRVVLIGTPLSGTLRAAEAILFGRSDLGEERLPALLAAARTWPALYQMLPAWPAVHDAKNKKPRPAEEQLTEPGGWPDLVDAEGGIPSDHLARARETQALLTGPFSALVPGVDTLVVFGRRQMTPIAVPRRGREHLHEFRNQRGDGLVPEKTTLELLPPPRSERRLVLTGKVRDHSFLSVDEDVQDAVRAFFDLPLPPLPAG